MHVFLGITGASGAPYAARLLEALAAADCEIGVAVSSAGIEVLALRLDPSVLRLDTRRRGQLNATLKELGVQRRFAERARKAFDERIPIELKGCAVKQIETRQ